MTSVGKKKKKKVVRRETTERSLEIYNFRTLGVEGRCDKSIPVERGDRDGEGRVPRLRQ